MSEDATHIARPSAKRPPTGLQAWQATLGYMRTRHSPDAVLNLRAYSYEARVLWSASVSWGHKEERITDLPSLSEALRALWAEVSRNHRIFESLEDAIRSPQNYNDAEWLDLATQESLQRLVWVTQSAFPGDWHLVMMYQPVETPDARVQARLLAQNNRVVVGGRGPSLLDACRTLFRNATPYFAGGAGGSSIGDDARR